MEIFLRNIVDYTGKNPHLYLVSRDWNESLHLNDEEILDGLYRRYPTSSNITDIIINMAIVGDVENLSVLMEIYPLNYSDIDWKHVLTYSIPSRAFEYIFRRVQDRVFNKRWYNYFTGDKSLYDVYGYDILSAVYRDDVESMRRIYESQDIIIDLDSNIGRLILLTGAANLYKQFLSDEEWYELSIAQGNVRDELMKDISKIEYALAGASKYFDDRSPEDDISMIRYVSEQDVYKDLKYKAIASAILHDLYDIVRDSLNRQNFIPVIVKTLSYMDDSIYFTHEFYNILQEKSLHPEWIGYYTDDRNMLLNMNITPAKPPSDYWRKLLATRLNNDTGDILLERLISSHTIDMTPRILDSIRNITRNNPDMIRQLKEMGLKL